MSTIAEEQSVSLESIAKKMGVSVTTVSRALNCRNKGVRAGASKRAEQIRALARELGYRPSAAPRAMVTKRYNAVALLRPMDYRYGQLPMHRLRGLEEALTEQSRQLVLTRVADDRLQDDGYVQTLLSRWFVDGILMDYEYGYPHALVDLLVRYHLPTVWLNVDLPYDSVHPDDFGGAVLAAQYLQKLGHKRIALWSYPRRPGKRAEHYSISARINGYTHAMMEAGLQPLVVNEWKEYNERATFIADYLRGDQAPTAWITVGPTDAMALTIAASRLGMYAPESFSHITFQNDGTVSDSMQLASIEIPEYQVGRSAIEMLARKIDKPQNILPSVVVPMKVIEGPSCRSI